MSLFHLKFNYIEPSIGRTSAYFNQLYLVSGLDYFRYCIFETDSNSYIALADYQIDKKKAMTSPWKSGMESLLNADELLKRNYPAVIAAVDTPYHTLVPAALYDPGQIESYLRLNFELPENMLFHADQISEINAWNIWAVANEREEVLKNQFSKLVLFHSITPLLKLFSSNPKQVLEKNVMHIHFIQDRIDIAVFSGNSLQFLNAFQVNSEEDVLYFALYAAEQLKIRPDEMILKVYGDIEMTSDTVKLLREFLPVTGPGMRPEGYNYSPLFDFPDHHYPTLFSLAICGS